jgi:ureidoacrylate peracid hydrolase
MTLRIELADRVAPGHTALLVIDLQNDFVAEGGYIEKVVGRSTVACRAILPAVARLIAAARQAKVPVIWITADYSHDKIPVPAQARLARQGWTEVCCAPGSWGHDFAGPRPQAGETVIAKHSFSSFHGTTLEDELRRRGIETLVVTGVQTNACVDYAIREGFVRGFYIAVPEDCVAAHMPELHAATLTATKFLFGDVVPSTALIERWRA